MYITHKNLYAKSWKRCLQWWVYAKSGTQSQPGQNYIWGKRSTFADILFRWIIWWTHWKRCIWKASIMSLLHFVGMHFRIFVHKFFVHLRTVDASPQKLAWPLSTVYFSSPYTPVAGRAPPMRCALDFAALSWAFRFLLLFSKNTRWRSLQTISCMLDKAKCNLW